MIRGTEGMSAEAILAEIRRGGRFVIYLYCVSIVVMTFTRSSDVRFLQAGESGRMQGLGWTLLVGWWGIPWGPIYSVQSIYANLSGGRDVTDQIVRYPTPPPPGYPPASPPPLPA